jgi:hypothetical protein
MISNGIRTYVLDYMCGRELCGSVRRLKHPTYGQCIHIRVTGTVSALTDLEEFFSNCTTDGIWTYEEMAPEEPRRTLPHPHFNIIESEEGPHAVKILTLIMTIDLRVHTLSNLVQ